MTENENLAATADAVASVVPAASRPVPDTLASDERFMNLALMLGRRGLGNAWPNPAVGAVVVKDGVILGRGRTQPGGRPHAETEALKRAGRAARGATLYVTLEPCPMCAGAILQARIPVVVYGATDPKAGAVDTLFRLLDDRRLNHRCEVVGGVLADRCGAMLTEFFQAQRRLGKK